jgi:thiol-disulfide isomerase/thioredoxin
MIAAAAVAVALAGIYGIAGTLRNRGDAECGPAVARARQLAAFTKGEVAAVQVAEEGRLMPNLTFVNAEGAKKSLADWRGRTVLLNLWATWCVPCRREMPSLDRLQARFDPAKLLVVALSGDSASAVSTVYRDFGVHALGIYLYGGAGAASALGLPGVPGTLLIDADGKEVGRRLGPAEWDSDEIVAALTQHLALPQNAPR